METSSRVIKWDSKPKESRAARVRENQRRHRARTKAYIATLERHLAELQSGLEDALTKNAALQSELQRIRSSCAAKGLEDGLTPSQPATKQTSVPASPDEPSAISTSPISVQYTKKERASLTSPAQHDGARISPTNSAPAFPATPERSLSPGCVLTQGEETFALTPLTEINEAGSYRSSEYSGTLSLSDQDDCMHLPPSAPGESTIPCKVAYSIIKQQNIGGFDFGVIRHFLTPGFRGATTQADGCRVESNRVFAVIDVISSPLPSSLQGGS